MLFLLFSGSITAQLSNSTPSFSHPGQEDWRFLLNYNQENNIYFWRGSGFLTGKYSVLANYVNYDFDNLLAQIRSFVFRKSFMDHTVIYPTTARGSLHAELCVNLEENGMLRWKEFIQNILIDRKIIVGSIKYMYKFTPNFTIEPGFSLFRRIGSHHRTTGLNTYRRRLSSINDRGITLALTYNAGASSTGAF